MFPSENTPPRPPSTFSSVSAGSAGTTEAVVFLIPLRRDLRLGVLEYKFS